MAESTETERRWEYLGDILTVSAERDHNEVVLDITSDGLWAAVRLPLHAARALGEQLQRLALSGPPNRSTEDRDDG